jgi:hypothetical protein
MAALIVMPLASAAAQDLEVFDLETFLDPDILTVTDESGQHDLAFFAAYLRTGYSQHFQYRSEYLRSGVASVDATGTFIYRRVQLTGRFTGLGYEQSGAGVARRAEARIGYYLVPHSPADSSDFPTITRLQFLVARTTTARQLGGTVLGADVDVSALASYDLVGGLSYAYYRPDRECRRTCTDEDTEPTQYLSANLRTETWELGERLGVDLGAGTGISYHRQELRWDTLRLELRAKKSSPKDRWAIYAVYAPAYQLDGGVGGTRLNHEVSLFLHRRLWSRAAELPW